MEGDQSSSKRVEKGSMNASLDMSLLEKQQLQEGEDEKTAANGALRSFVSAASWDEHDLAASKKRSSRVSHDSLSTENMKAKLPATPASVARRRHLHSSSPLPPPLSSIHPSLDPEPPIANSSSIQKARRKSKRSFGTCTTATSTVQGSDDQSMHSVDSSSTQGDALATKNFRFTSFPASLPRIHSHPPLKTTFAKGALIAPVSTAKSSLHNKPHVGYHTNSCNNDSHNTSLSSWNHTADGIGCSDEEEDDVSPLQSTSFHQLSTPRTRLNFNDVTLLQSETDGSDNHPHLLDHLLLEEVWNQTKKIPFRTSNRIHRYAEWSNEGHNRVTTPGRSAAGASHTQSDYVDTSNIESDQDLQFQLPCSPIPDIPEEETCTGDSAGTGISSSPSCGTAAVRRNDFVAIRASAVNTPLTHCSSGGVGHSLFLPTSSRRPMPDMHAFEDCGGPAMQEHPQIVDGLSSSSISTSTTHSSGDLLPLTMAPQSPKLLCPPTPVRVHPTFRDAADDGPLLHTVHRTKLARSNSLITNKVLATCSPQLHSFAFLPSLANSKATKQSFSEESSIPRRLEGHQSETSSVPTIFSPIPYYDSAEATAKPVSTVVSLVRNFEVLSTLGSGAFADVYKVVSRRDGRMYAVKRNRRQFRSKREREAALSEVRSMQRIQSQLVSVEEHGSANDHTAVANHGIYLLFFYQAWQEDGHILCQTELCCRDTCREMIDTIQSWNAVTSLKFPTIASSCLWLPSASSMETGRVVPESVIWKICHDISAGLAFIHSNQVALVHNDIKPSNIFFVEHPQQGALCKIGDFGMARGIGMSEDGQEGDPKYMTLEVLQSGASYPSADIFSLGLTLYEMASHAHLTIPSDGHRWHELRSGMISALDFPADRSLELIDLIRAMMDPNCNARPSANAILSEKSVLVAGTSYNQFLRDYIHEVELQEQQEKQWVNPLNDEQTPQNAMSRPVLCSPPLHQIPQLPFGVLHSPNETALASS